MGVQWPPAFPRWPADVPGVGRGDPLSSCQSCHRPPSQIQPPPPFPSPCAPVGEVTPQVDILGHKAVRGRWAPPGKQFKARAAASGERPTDRPQPPAADSNTTGGHAKTPPLQFPASVPLSRSSACGWMLSLCGDDHGVNQPNERENRRGMEQRGHAPGRPWMMAFG